MYELDNFEKALAHFGTRVDIIIALEMGGKLDADTAYKSLSKKTRICDKCGVEKSLKENFQVVKYFRDGYSYYCNECSKPKPKD